MPNRLFQSLRTFNYKLYFSLLALGFIPTVYTTVRVFWLAQLPDVWAFSIAGQLTWVNLIYEILNESIILPLFYFIGNVRNDRTAFANRIRTGLFICFVAYAALSVCVILGAEPLLWAMGANADILAESAQYIRIESIGNVFSVLAQFSLVALVAVNKSKYLYIFTAARLVLCVVTDIFFVSALPFSLALGIDGIGYSNIVVHTLLLLCALGLLCKEGIPVFQRSRPDFTWTKEFFKIGGISGLESLVRNLAYMLMICRMVNLVGEQGTYWVANNFIWSWLLLPVLQLGELIKLEIAADAANMRRKTPGYLAVTILILCVWVISIPGWKPFGRYVLGLADADAVFSLVLCLVGFYGLFAFQNVFDATFYALGKTEYMLAESVITNVLYYGTAFILYVAGVWSPTLMGIALLFGCGTAFDSVVSFLAYVYLRRKMRQNAANTLHNRSSCRFP